MLPARPSSPWAMSQLAPFLQRIKKDNSDGWYSLFSDADCYGGWEYIGEKISITQEEINMQQSFEDFKRHNLGHILCLNSHKPGILFMGHRQTV